MASLEVLCTQNDSASFLSGEYSLLPDVEMPAGNVQDRNIKLNNDNFNFTNLQSALTAVSSGSSVEVNSQLCELIKENNQLKEELSKTASVMEEQLKKAKDENSSLINENSELREIMACMKKNEKQPDRSCMRCTTLETGLNNMLGVDYVEENEHLLCEWSYFRENLCENLKYVCQHLEEISNSKKSQSEKLLLECYILMLKFKIAFLEGSVEECAPFASLRTDEETGFEVVRLKSKEDRPLNVVMEDLRKEIKDKDEELICLKRERENFLEKVKAYELKMQECEKVLKSQAELLNNKLKTESSIPQQYRESCKNLEQQIKGFQERLEQNSVTMSDDHVIQELQEEIQNLKEILKLEQQTNKKDKEKFSEVMTKCEKLQVDYDRVTKLLEIQSKDEKKKSKELTVREEDAKRYMEEADHLTAKLMDAQYQLEERNAEIKKLQDQLAEVKQDAEITVLHETQSHSSGNQGRRSDQKKPNGKAVEIISCPICNEGFTEERAAQNHVNRCLENEDME